MVVVVLVFVVFVCLCFVVAFVWVSVCLFFPLLPACLSSFTDWCLVHRQQSREQKKRQQAGPKTDTKKVPEKQALKTHNFARHV